MTTTRTFRPTPSTAVRRYLDRIPRMVGTWEDHADMQRNIGDELADREGIRRDDDAFYDSLAQDGDHLYYGGDDAA